MGEISASPAQGTVPQGALSTLSRSEALTEKVAGEIREAILSGQLPPGTRLSVPELARQLGVSRTPARESLLVLEREGLVAPRPNAGMAVIAGGTQDIIDLLDIREGLEAMTARRAAERIDGGRLERLESVVSRHEAMLKAGDLDRHVALDAEFHAIIRDAAGNARLARQLVQIEQQLRVLNSRLSRAKGWSAEAVIRDHRAIFTAIESRNPDAAERQVRKHIARTRAFHIKSARSAAS